MANRGLLKTFPPNIRYEGELAEPILPKAFANLEMTAAVGAAALIASADEIATKFEALARFYNFDPDDADTCCRLALVLAIVHVPGFKIAFGRPKTNRVGRPGKDHREADYMLSIVDGLIEAGRATSSKAALKLIKNGEAGPRKFRALTVTYMEKVLAAARKREKQRQERDRIEDERITALIAEAHKSAARRRPTSRRTKKSARSQRRRP